MGPLTVPERGVFGAGRVERITTPRRSFSRGWMVPSRISRLGTLGHGLCGCDACLDVILAALRRVFLLMPFRRSNRRLVYNFLLTYYLLRCRLSVVRRGLLGGPDSEARRQSTPIVPWKTTEFVWTSLAQQRQLVRAGQARFRLLAEGRFHLDSESSRPSVAASST
jgi:hypothetical protein